MKRPGGANPVVVIAVVVAVAAIAAGVMIIGSPAEQRGRRLDERRVEDLRDAARGVNLHWTRHGRLPASLDLLSREAGVNVATRDPASGESYEYRVLNDTTYELCATFEQSRAYVDERRARRAEPEPTPEAAAPPPPSTGVEQPVPPARVPVSFWSHGAGRQCYQPPVERSLP